MNRLQAVCAALKSAGIPYKADPTDDPDIEDDSIQVGADTDSVSIQVCSRGLGYMIVGRFDGTLIYTWPQRRAVGVLLMDVRDALRSDWKTRHKASHERVAA